MTQPVFVDRSGRRARWFARVCWALGAVVCLYIALVVVALVAPPGVISLGLGPLLPKPNAPGLTDSKGTRAKPVEVFEHPTPAASAPGRTRTPGAGNPHATQTVPPGQGKRTPSPAPTSLRSPAPTPTGPGRSSDHPTPKPRPSRTPPGRP